jgi:hypothetical protein
MSGIITKIDDDDLEIFKKQYVNLIDIQDEITKLEEQIPDKRKKKLYKEWLTKVNFFIDMYNAKSKYKVLNRYK